MCFELTTSSSVSDELVLIICTTSLCPLLSTYHEQHKKFDVAKEWQDSCLLATYDYSSSRHVLSELTRATETQYVIIKKNT